MGATGHAGCAPAAGGDAALPVSQLFAHAGALCAGGSEGGAEGGGEAVTRRQPGHEVVVTALQYLVAPRGGSMTGAVEQDCLIINVNNKLVPLLD